MFDTFFQDFPRLFELEKITTDAATHSVGGGFLISPAYAQAGGGAGGADFLGGFLLPLLLIFVVFYFLLIRPQNKKLKAHRQMTEGLRRGDKVVTSGGIIGSVSKIDNDAEITVEIAEKVRVKVLRHTITEVLNTPKPGNQSAADRPETAKSQTKKRTSSRSGTRTGKTK